MRCELRVTSGTHQGRRMWLRDGQTIQIGRTEYADLCIADDPLMSRVHFALDSDGGMLRIRDLGSRNGTYVNGQLIKIQELHHGDMIVAGQTRFDVVVEQAEGSGSQFHEGGSGVYQPGGSGVHPSGGQGGVPYTTGNPQPTGSFGGSHYPGAGAPTSVTGYGGSPIPTPAQPPSYGAPSPPTGGPGAAPTQYPTPYPHPQNPAQAGPRSSYSEGPAGGQAPPPGYGQGQPAPNPQPHHPVPPVGYPPTSSMPPAHQAHPPSGTPSPGQSYPPAPGAAPMNYPNSPLPPLGEPHSARPTESVFGAPIAGSGPQTPGGTPHVLPPDHPAQNTNSPSGPYSSHYPSQPTSYSEDPHQARTPGQSLYGPPNIPPQEMGNGTYQIPTSSPQAPNPQSSPRSPIISDEFQSSDAQTPLQSSTPFATGSSSEKSRESIHRTPFDDPESDGNDSPSPFGSAGDAANEDSQSHHSSPFDSSVAAAMQTLAGDFSNMEGAGPTNQPPAAGATPPEPPPAPSMPSSQPPPVTGWSIKAEELPPPPKSPHDSTANLVPKSVPSDKLPTQTIGNEVAGSDKEATPYGTAIFDSALEESTLAYSTFSSVFANVAYHESQSHRGLRCFESHGEKSSAADIAKSLSERNQTYALVNIARLEESSRRVIDTNPNRSSFTRLMNDVVLITKADPLDFIGLLRSNWGRDALILLTAKLQKQKVLQELTARAHLFHQPSTLSNELQNATPQDADKIFGKLEAFLVEGMQGKSWTIFLNPVFDGDWMRLGMPCPPVNESRKS